MKNFKKYFIVSAACAGIAVVAISIDILTSRDTVFNLKPGFRRRTTIIHSNSSESITSNCFRLSTRNGTPEFFSPSSPLYRHKERHILVLEEDFDMPITITVEAVRSRETGNEPDPAIVIKSLTGETLICDDYYDNHGRIEVLNTDDYYNTGNLLNMGFASMPGFQPKAGTYLMEIWSYYQPAKSYKITITEDR